MKQDVALSLYQEELLDHYKFPRNRKTIENSTHRSSQHNPSCGDTVAISVVVFKGVITDIGFIGSGCIISQAAASLLTEFVLGKNVTEVCNLTASSMQELVKIPLGPNRLRCALLSLYALQEAVSGNKNFNDS